MTDPMGHTLSDLVRWMCGVAAARLPGSPRTVSLKFTRATLQQWLDRIQQALARHNALLAACHSALHDLEGMATVCEQHGDTRAAACRNRLQESRQGLMFAEASATPPDVDRQGSHPSASKP